MDKLHGLAGWQWLFLIEGIPAILLGFVVFFVLEDGPQTARWLTDTQRQWLQSTLRDEDAEERPGEKVSTFSAFGMPRVWLLAFVYFTLNTTSYGISLWLPTVLKQGSSFGILAIGYISTLPYLLAVGTMVVNGLHSDKTNERFWHVAIPAFAAAISLIASGKATPFFLLLGLFAVAYAGTQCMLGPFWAVSSRMLAGASAAAGIALINSVGNLGSGLGPYIIGFISTRTGSFQLALFLVGTTLAAGGCTILIVRAMAEQGRASS
jgi:sugar phosphate permease